MTETQSSNVNTPTHRAWPALLALAIGGFAIGTTEFASMGLVPQIASDFSASVPSAGWVITAYAIGVVIGAPILTAAAARLERKKVLLLLMGMFVVGHVFSVDGTHVASVTQEVLVRRRRNT